MTSAKQAAHDLDKGSVHPGRTKQANLPRAELIHLLQEFADAHALQLNIHKPTLMREVEGLLFNLERYGYLYCPCRMADISGDLVRDKRISCPCAYHKREIMDVGYCKCELFTKPLGDRPDLISTTIHRMQIQRRYQEDLLSLVFSKPGWNRGEVKLYIPEGYRNQEIDIESDSAYEMDSIQFENQVLFFYLGFSDNAILNLEFHKAD
jgi:ferredoxin-thioredoxin reductase catalytic chain